MLEAQAPSPGDVTPLSCPGPVRLVAPRYGHFAAHSGYDRLSNYIEAAAIRPHPLLRLLGETLLRPVAKLAARRSGKWEYSRRDWTIEVALLSDFLTSRNRLYHFVYAERSFHLTARVAGKNGHVLVGTVHHPIDHQAWLFRDHGHFRAFDHLIVMERGAVPWWERVTGRENVSFIPHGVDTDYFTPLADRKAGPMRVVFAGAHERDFQTLARVIEAAEAANADIRFDLVGANGALAELAGRFARVRHHRALADDAYRLLLQQADVLLLPLHRSTACNTVLEALACGTPVITTRGGIEDYLDNECARVVAVGDTRAMVEALLVQAGAAPGVPASRVAARRKALSFSWPVVADMHVELYASVFERARAAAGRQAARGIAARAYLPGGATP